MSIHPGKLLAIHQFFSVPCAACSELTWCGSYCVRRTAGNKEPGELRRRGTRAEEHRPHVQTSRPVPTARKTVACENTWIACRECGQEEELETAIWITWRKSVPKKIRRRNCGSLETARAQNKGRRGDLVTKARRYWLGIGWNERRGLYGECCDQGTTCHQCCHCC